jgi:2-methylisocitrate lyase-like PEP mutase family enzyme
LQTELFDTKQLGENGVSIVLHPLSAHRAMVCLPSSYAFVAGAIPVWLTRCTACGCQAKAAATVYKALIQEGHAKNVTSLMQTRKELYECGVRV